MAFLIDDATSYFNLIKMNKLKTEAEDREAIEALEAQLTERVKAADKDGRSDRKRDAYMFFQGAVMGMLIQSKTYAQHLKAQASEQGVSLRETDVTSH